MMKRGFTAAWQIKDLFSRSAPNGGRERLRLDGFAPANPSATSTPSVGSLSQSAYALNSSFAFTLAEVLITLAIIGVVVALTIPTVIKKVQDNQLKTAFKKAYSNFTNAYAKTIADMGYTPECYYGTPSPSSEQHGSECSIFWNEFEKNFKVIKKCNNNALNGGCVPRYSKYATHSSCAVLSDDWINNKLKAIILADGTIMVRFDFALLFDTNGMKPPNKPGYDLFWIGLFTPEGKKPTMTVPAQDNCFPTETGGRTSFEMLQYAFR